MKKWGTLIFLTLLIIYEEILYSISIFNTMSNIGYIVLFSIPIAVVLYLITTLKKGWNIFSTYFFTIAIIIIFIAQLVYYNVYEAIISLYSATNGAGQIWQFADTIFGVVFDNIWVELAMILPFIVLIILTIFKILNFEKIGMIERIIALIIRNIITVYCCTLYSFHKSI